MRPWIRYLICGFLGVLLGVGGAAWSIRIGALGSARTIGAWTTGKDYGTAEASAYTRAVVALRGLLALPATEARYYNAAVDSAGQGYLVANQPGIYSVGSAGLPSAEQAHWSVSVAPDRQPDHWLPTDGKQRFELTLRAYLPDDGGKGNFTRDQLPTITRENCA